ncbi:MAG: TonB-dependent receptor plug domain-containing protein [Kofleriaceae bacterium]
MFLLMLFATSVANAEVRGRVIDAETKQPISGATVYGDDGTPVVTDETGEFVLTSSTLSITALDGDHEASVVEVMGREAIVIELASVTAGEVIEIRGEQRARTPGGVTLDRGQLAAIPGSRGDVLSGIKNLPGIANNGSLTPLSSGLVIRGSSPESSRILVDGFEIPILYHFLGVQSVIPTEMLSDVEYMPGTFGVGYGRASGGIVAATSRDTPTQTSGFAELSFINVSGLVQGPIGDRGGYAVAARRSVIDAILPAVLPDDGGLAFTAYPRYYDYQAKASFRPREGWDMQAFLFGSDDRVELASDRDNAMDPVASGQFANATSFTRLIASLRRKRPGLDIRNAISVYTDTNHFEVGTERYLLLDRLGLATRSELLWDPDEKLRIVAGTESDLTRTDYDIKFTRPPREGDPRGPNFTQDALIVTTGSNTFRDLAAWAAAVVYPVPSLEITAGARADVYLRNDDLELQPRGQIAWTVADGATLRAAAGTYTRPPEYLDQGLQPDLDPEHAAQFSAGGEKRLDETVLVRATTFYNRLSDLLVLPADRRDPASLGGYENLGAGDVRGIELLVQARTERFFGWLAYTGAIAKRRDGEGMRERRFDYDQAHNFIAVGSLQLTPHWRIGGRFQLTTGKPYTPVVGTIYQADVDAYLPAYGAPNSQRVDLQHQLDLRVDRTWSFARWKLAAYLDISNVYINAAAIDYQYNFDYSRRTAITTLPIIPSFGLRGEL